MLTVSGKSVRTLVGTLLVLMSFAALSLGVTNLNYLFVVLFLQGVKVWACWRVRRANGWCPYFSPWVLILLGAINVLFLLGLAQGNAWKDTLRDYDSLVILVLAYDGFKALLAESPMRIFAGKSVFVLISALSLVIVGISGYALATGVNRYELRGELIPYGANWLIMGYALFLGQRAEGLLQNRRYTWVQGLLVIGIIASFSRTDLVCLLVLVSLAYLLYARGRFATKALRFGTLTVAVACVSLVLLQVQALAAMVHPVNASGDDLSIGWRLLENMTLLNEASRWGPVRMLFGCGLGSNLMLPPGIVDFNGNDHIPFLHNSYLTHFMKFGLVGSLFILASLVRIAWRCLVTLPRHGSRAAIGAGFVLVVILLKAMTMHGLSENGHLLWLAMALALAAVAARDQRRPALERFPS